MYKIINGKEISQQIKDELKEKVNKLPKDKVPRLVVIQLGKDKASSTYVRNKELACEYIGIKSTSYRLPDSTSETELLQLIEKLNNDKRISGILVQLPLPKHINESKILNAITPDKDVDCFNPINIGKLFIGEDGFKPCTPAGIIELLKRSNIDIQGKNCVIVGRSNIVGKPVALMMLKENATVTICHSRTKNLKEITKQADILIVAIGKKQFITSEYIKDGAIVIDVGIHRDENNKLCGDVNFEEVANHTSYITPVPGGVGPMTIAMLMKNIVNTI